MSPDNDKDDEYSLDPTVDISQLVEASDALDAPECEEHDELTELGAGANPRKGKAAVEEAKRWTVEDVFIGCGYCLKAIRTIFAVDALYVSAAEAWAGAKFKHKVTRGDEVPRATPVYWTGGSQGYGHVAISVGGGLCRSTDWKRVGYVDLARIDDITAKWGQQFQGWARDINAVTVKDPIKQAPEPKRDDGDPSRGARIDEAIELLAKARAIRVANKKPAEAEKITTALNALRDIDAD